MGELNFVVKLFFTKGAEDAVDARFVPETTYFLCRV